MSTSIIRFKFLKTPQLRHKFLNYSGACVFPRHKAEVFDAIYFNGFYEFSGKSLSGKVPGENFVGALTDGVITIVD